MMMMVYNTLVGADRSDPDSKLPLKIRQKSVALSKKLPKKMTWAQYDEIIFRAVLKASLHSSISRATMFISAHAIIDEGFVNDIALLSFDRLLGFGRLLPAPNGGAGRPVAAPLPPYEDYWPFMPSDLSKTRVAPPINGWDEFIREILSASSVLNVYQKLAEELPPTYTDLIEHMTSQGTAASDIVRCFPVALGIMMIRGIKIDELCGTTLMPYKHPALGY